MALKRNARDHRTVNGASVLFGVRPEVAWPLGHGAACLSRAQMVRRRQRRSERIRATLATKVRTKISDVVAKRSLGPVVHVTYFIGNEFAESCGVTTAEFALVLQFANQLFQ